MALVRVTNLSKETKKEPEETIIVDQPATIEKKDERALLESTDYHSFKGFLLHKVRPKTEITLGNKIY